MAGIRDDSAGSYGQWQTPDDWSWLDHVKAAGSDTGNALYNLSSNVIEGLSPFAPTATQYGKPSLQVPPMIQGIADSYSRLAGTPSQPGNAYDLTGVKELDAPIQQDMSNVLLSLYGGNAMAGVSKPAGSVGMFAGRNAKTADLNALSKAEQLAGQGATRDAIWNETGWFQGPDQKWRFEIDDSGSGVSQFKSQNGPLSSILEHDNLAQAYPDVASIPVNYKRNQGIGSGGYDSGGYQFLNGSVAPEGISIEAPYRNQGQFSGRSIGLHEAQHAIQNREGFTPGSSPINFTSMGVNRKMAFDNPGVDLYRKVAGEVEARNVQQRMNMSADERKATPPWQTQDIPFEDQIVSFYSDTGKPSLFGSALATAGEQPKGALGVEYVKGARPEPSASTPKAEAMGLSDVLAESNTLQHPYAKAQELLAALKEQFPNMVGEKGRIDNWRSLGGDSAYIKTPIGTIRVSDHFANQKPDVYYDATFSTIPEAISKIAENKVSQIERLRKEKTGRPFGVDAETWRDFKSSDLDPSTLFSDNRPSLFGSALATAGEQPRNALGAGAMREAVEQQPVRAYRGFNPVEGRNFTPKELPLTDQFLFSSSSPDVAGSYAGIYANQDWITNVGAVAPVEMNFKNPKVYDARGSVWNDVDGTTVNHIADKAARDGHDGLIVNNVLDALDASNPAYSPATTYVALQRGTVKSPLTGETLFSDTGKPSIFGSAAATAGEQPFDLNEFLMRYSAQ